MGEADVPYVGGPDRQPDAASAEQPAGEVEQHGRPQSFVKVCGDEPERTEYEQLGDQIPQAPASDIKEWWGLLIWLEEAR